AEHLQNDLQRAGIEPWGWIVNSSLAAAQTHHPLLQKRARSEAGQIARVRDELSSRYAVVPMQAEEPVGVEKLKSLCETADNSAAA
ncbi:arsenical pump-driving ATPase, partial [Gammaproteobacteria bacterium]|nr:arsenical pump-driving ATPase [Gammaproteobacteria bacterium]